MKKQKQRNDKPDSTPQAAASSKPAPKTKTKNQNPPPPAPEQPQSKRGQKVPSSCSTNDKTYIIMSAILSTCTCMYTYVPEVSARVLYQGPVCQLITL